MTAKANILSVCQLFQLKAQWSILGSTFQDFAEKQSIYIFCSIPEKY